MLTSIDRIIDNFEVLDDWTDRYRYIIELGKKLPGLPDSCREECNRVQGCVSRVWLVSGPDAGQMRELLQAAAGDKAGVAQGDPRCPMYFNADSDAHIVRGLIAILLHIYCGKTAQQVLDLDPNPIFAKLGLDQHLSISRANGLHSMVKRLREYAAEELARTQAPAPS